MSDDSSVPVDREQSWQRRLLSRSARLLTIVIATGVILRLSLRDGTHAVAPLFYALPLPVLAFLAALGVGCSVLLRQRRAVLLWGSVACAIAVWCVVETVQWHAPNEDPTSLRILCWNVARREAVWDAEIAETVNRVQPDIVGLIEAGGSPEELRRFWKKHCPDYEVVPLGGGLLCLTHGTPGQGSLVSLSDGGYAGQVPVRFGDVELTVMLVDINSNPFRFRAAPLATLAQRAETLSDRPVVIMGDFNTPVDSVHFQPLRVHHRNAFEAAGNGYGATWPIPFPVLSLDQIWTNARVKPLRCEHQWTIQSDHRRVVADVAILPPD